MRARSKRSGGASRRAMVLAAALGMGLVSCRGGTPHGQCEDAVKQQEHVVAMVACAASYQQSGAEKDLLLLAQATLRGASYQKARPLFEALKEEAYLGEAELALAYCDERDGEVSSARTRLQRAMALFDKTANEGGKLNAQLSLAQLHLAAGELDAALETANGVFQRVRQSSEAFEPSLISRAFITIIDVVSRIQDYESTRVILEEARQRRWNPSAQRWFDNREATYHQERGDPSRAKHILQEAMKHPPSDARLVLQDRRLLAWLEYLTEESDKATKILDELQAERREEPFDSLLLRALIAGAREDWPTAKRFLREAEEVGAPDVDFHWMLVRAKAELAEWMGEQSLAQRSYEETIRQVSFSRLSAPTADSFFMAGQRGPYEALIALHASRHQWREALKVVLLLDEDKLLRSTEAALPGAKLSYASTVPTLPAGYDPFVAAEAIIDDVIAAWSAQGTLSIVVVPEARKLGPFSKRARKAYRIVVRDGAVTGQELEGTAESLVATFESFSPSSKSSERAGKVLAKALLPDDGTAAGLIAALGEGDGLAEMARRDRLSRSPVTILPLGRLGKVQPSALLDEAGKLVVGKRALTRTFALREATPVPSHRGHSVVLAADRKSGKKLTFLEKDADMAVGSLSKSHPRESILRFGLGTATPATRDRLWQAKDASVFYLAAHVDATDRQRTIILDGAGANDEDPVSVSDLRAAGFAPKLAILPNCGSALASDDGSWGSVAAALSKAGSLTVIATQMDVDDEQTHALMARLLSQPDWETAPALALGRVQQMAKDGPIDGVQISAAQRETFMTITRAPYVPLPQTASLQQPSPQR